MAIEMSNPGALAGAAGAKNKRIGSNDATSGPRGQGRYTGFKSLKWGRNVLDVIAAARRTKITDSPTFLVAAVALDMACFAGQDGLLFRAADDAAAAVGASASNVRDARDWLCRAGLAEKTKVTNDQIAESGRKHTGKKKGRDAQDFQLLFIPVKDAVFRLHAGGNTDTYSAPMQADNTTPVSAPMQAPFSAPMGVTTVDEPRRARARANARPAPITTRGSPSVIEDDLHTDKRASELAALDAPPPASDRSASVPMDARPFSSEPDGALGLIPVSASGGEGADFRAEAITMADLDRIAADEREAAIMLADEVRSLFPKIHDADHFVSDLRCGFTQRQDDLAVARATTTTLGLLMGSEGHEAATRQWRSLLEILSRALQSDQILAFRNAVAAAMVEQRTRKSSMIEAAYA